MSESSGKIEWYLAREGQQHGPLSEAELDKFIELGHLKPMDLLWRAGFDDWRPATDVFPPRAPAPAAPEPVAPAQPEAQTASNVFSPTEQIQPAPQRMQPHETTQPVRQHNVSTGDPTAPTAAADVIGAPTTQPGATSHQDAFRPEPNAPFNAGNPASPNAPGQGSLQAPADNPPQQSSSLSANPSLRTGSSSTLGQPQYGPSAATQRPPQGEPSFGAAPQSTVNRPTTSVARHRQEDQLDDDEFLEDEEEGRSGWLMVAAALFLFVLLGAGGLFAYNNQQQISALYADLVGSAKRNDVAVVRAPDRATREAATPGSDPGSTSGTTIARLSPPQPATPVRPLPELPILKSKLWQFAKKEFGAWTDNRLSELAEQNKSKEEANNYLIASFVQLRRENAHIALRASPDKLEHVATSFVDTLRALTSRSVDACYALISKGEGTPELAKLFFDSDISPKLEAQMLAILYAIADGSKDPIKAREQPTEEDFNALSKELAKRGWTAADLKLFSDPTALSKAEPKLVCRLVTEWFATQTKLGDQTTRDQLIAASLRPVIGG